MKTKAALKGPNAFDQFYQEIFQHRWGDLKKALLAPKKYISQDGYLMDGASAVAAGALEFKPEDKVLDMCAAPGGKTLILARKIGEGGVLVANERSTPRRTQLQKVLRQFLSEQIRGRIKITGHDATKWGLYEKENYDAILLDAPCSSERHTLHSQKHLENWKLSRTKILAKKQFAMLCSALLALKSGGQLVYVTCALSSLENDQQIERLLVKKAGQIEFHLREFATGEPTKYGWQILPDQTDWGPIYISILTKN